MSFANAALLLGMALGAIPIIIHLINRHRARLRRFAAIDFLLLSDKRLARRLKLKQLIVLALRVLLIVGLALALSKPYVEPDVLAAPDTSDPGGVAIIIDDSMSMMATGPDGEPLLTRALAQARAVVASGGPRTSFAVIASGSPARLLTTGLVYDKEAARRAIDRITPGARTGDLEGALTEAGRALSQATEPRRQIIIIGDSAAHGWRPLSATWSFVPITQVDVIDVRDGAPLDNVAITGVSVTAGEGADDRRLELAVDITSYAAERREVRLEVEVGDRVVADRVVLPPGEQVTARLEARATRGATRGVARIATDDVLDVDDTWHFTVDQSQTVNVLVVNGAPRAMAFLDELFFLRAALRARQPGEVPLNPVFVTAGDFRPAQIAPMDVVILANVGRLTPEQGLALENFVRDGGGVFITAGDELDLDSGRSYGELLPYPLRDFKVVANRDDPAAALSALTVDMADFEHPVMEVFDGIDEASLFKARVYAYALLDTMGREGARVVASFTGGIPGLVEGVHGRGRVMMLTTTLDLDWSDLAIRSSFLPLVQRICQYLARTLDQEGSKGFIAGEGARIPAPDGRGPLTLARPDGVDALFNEDDVDATTGTLYVEGTELPGHYRLHRSGDERVGVDFAINADRSESDLRLASESVIAEVIAEVTRDNGILPDVDLNDPEVLASSLADERRTLLWPYILAALFLLFGAEAYLVVRS